MNIRDHIRIVPGFPKPGINFYDISTLLAHPQAWQEALESLSRNIKPYAPDLLIGIEARGFLVGTPLAFSLGCAFGMIRKKGKLPGRTLSHKYDLEYGSDEIEIQPDLFKPGARVVVVDDLLATGGTLEAANILVRKAGAKVIANACIIELEGLGGRQKLAAPLIALLQCPA